MNKVRVHIKGRGSFEGLIIDQTTTSFKVTHESNPIVGEWFAKQADCVWCVVI